MYGYILLLLLIVISIVICIVDIRKNKKKIKECDEQLERYNKLHKEKTLSLMELQLINYTYMKDVQTITTHYLSNKEPLFLQLKDLEISNLKPKFLTEFSEDNKQYIKELEGDLEELIGILTRAREERLIAK